MTAATDSVHGRFTIRHACCGQNQPIVDTIIVHIKELII